MTGIRRFRLYSDAEKAALQLRFERVLTEWNGRWFGGRGTDVCRIESWSATDGDEPAGEIYSCAAQGCPGTTIIVPMDAVANLANLMFNSGAPGAARPGKERRGSALMEQVVFNALSGLAADIAEQPFSEGVIQRADASAALQARGEPRLSFVCELARIKWWLVVNDEELSRHLPGPAVSGSEAQPLEAVARHVTRRARLTARVMLGRARLNLTDIASLAVGDVVVLEHRHDEPLQMQFSPASVSLPCHLGLRDDVMVAALYAHAEPGERLKL